MRRFLLLALLAPTLAFGHSLTPSRLEAQSGSKFIAYRFTAINAYQKTYLFRVECFKNDLNHPYECKSAPPAFYVPAKGSRKFKVQIEPDSDGVYLVCTLQDVDEPIVTRVCARFGVGVDPSTIADRDRIGKPTKHPSIPARAGQSKGG